MGRRRGLGLPEMLIALSLFSVVGLVSYAFMSQGVKLWKNVSGNEAAAFELKKGQRFLERELTLASTRFIEVAPVPASLPGGGSDGSAVWFLSAVDPSSGTVVRKPDGSPFWQRNVLYYLVVPQGDTCPGGQGPGGADDRCPHKVLLRKVIDSGVATGPLDDPAVAEETLLADPSPYLTRPQGVDVYPMYGEPGLQRVEVAAVRLLWLQVAVTPDPRFPGEVEVDMRAVAIADAQKEVALGTDAMATGRFTLQQIFSCYPRN